MRRRKRDKFAVAVQLDEMSNDDDDDDDEHDDQSSMKQQQGVDFAKIVIAKGCRRMQLAIISIISCLLLVGLLFASSPSIRADAHSLAQQNNQIVFPSAAPAPAPAPATSQERQQHKRHNQSARPQIYINPHPSTLSGRYEAAPTTSEQRLNNQRQSSSQQTFYQPPIGARSQQQQQWPNQQANLGSTPSSIGKSEKNQVAEWPFFKSFQTVRNNQLSNQLQALPSTTSQPVAVALSGSDPAHTQATTATTTSGSQEAPQSSSHAVPTTTTTPGPVASTTTTAKMAPSTTSADEPTTSNLMTDEAEEDSKTERMIRGELVANLSRATTSTIAPPVEETTTATTLATGQRPMRVLKEQMLIPPKVHNSIQTAVNRLVEMSSRSDGGGTTTLSPETLAPNVVRMNGNSNGMKSSLSLNVLLKNFGVFNLTSLDQILLKSSLGNSSRSGSPESLLHHLPIEHQKIEINGVHHSHSAPNEPKASASASDDKEGNESPAPGEEGQQAAAHSAASGECKIEYTTRHINISLANDDKSDYTCDYIIDRKLTAQKLSAIRANQKICKLQLKSEFFANETSGRRQEEEEGADAQTICSGSTYLSIGSVHFCYLERGDSSESPGPSLNRILNFPTDREDFDIRLVHKTSTRQAASSPASNGEIRLEIRPIVDERDNCGSDVQQQPNSQASRVQVLADGQPNDVSSQVVPIQNGGAVSSTSTRKKFVVKVAPERHLHPINQNMRLGKPSKAPSVGANSAAPTSGQTFDVDRASPQPGADADQRLTSLWSVPTCGHGATESLHTSTIGQLLTPNYPANYAANSRCRYIIKRVSQAHCKLLLHFSDFDLGPPRPHRADQQATGQQPAKDEDCLADYLQIGETRYCNKYAMMNHKMYLNFSEAATSELMDEAIGLLFVSDSSVSGRGFLIKYQQLLCDESGAELKRKPGAPRSRPSLQAQAQHEPSSKLPTLAPPVQQPDFSLALKSNKTRSLRPDKKPPGNSGQAAQGQKNATATTSSNQGLLQMASTVPTGNLLLAESPSISTTTATLTAGPAADWSPPSAIQCNQVQHEMHFLLSSHNYPQAYANNLNCLFYIRRNSSEVCYLELTFLKFDLEADSDCRYDFFEINSVRLCGSLRHETTRIYLFDEPLKLAKFRTDSVGTKEGFLIKVDQLECAPDGSILRPLSGQVSSSAASAASAGSPRPNSTVTFEYDASLLRGTQKATQQKQARSPQRQRPTNLQTGTLSPIGSASAPLSAPSSRQLGSRRYQGEKEARAEEGGGPSSSSSGEHSSSQANAPSGQCDELLHGNEITIRSPHWPESYAHDETLSSCRYTILRQHFGAGSSATSKQSICQLELRFIHLRLGPGDCLDIGGMETLCGFNARNLVKYYPFGERQTHLTLTFTSAPGTAAKLFAARSAAAPPYQLAGSTSGAQNHSHLLPLARAPLRFVLLARQLECIDGFLSPQVELDLPSAGLLPPASSFAPANTTNLLYTSPAGEGQADLPPRPRYVNRTSSSSPLQPQPLRQGLNESQLAYDQQQASVYPPGATATNLEPLGSRQQGSSASRTSSSAAGTLMYSFANSLAASTTSPASSNSCLLQLGQYNGILASSNILRARGESQAMPLQECEIRFKLLPGFCGLQLNFGEFDLQPARLGASVCPGEYLEVAGVQYCGQELQNSTRLLATTLPGQRHVSLRSSHLTSQNSFRAIFKQRECEPQPLLPLAEPKAPRSNGSSSTRPNNSDPAGPSAQQAVKRVDGAQAGNNRQETSIDFREIVLREEFFELDSSKLSRHSPAVLYEPNMFIVYKIKRAHPSVCKLRLMFYKFDLEQEEQQQQQQQQNGCRRDFLDINSQDRLCGSIRLGRESSRDYEWPPSGRDFKISFVSDSSTQRAGFHIFGQQIQCAHSALLSDPKQTLEGQPRAQTSTTVAPNVPSRNLYEQNQESNQSQEQEQASSMGKRVVPDGPAANQPSSQAQQKRLPANCSQVIDGLQFELASPGWPNQYDALGSCHYLIRRARPDICSVTLSVNSLILDIQPRRQAHSTSPSDEPEAEEGQCMSSRQRRRQEEEEDQLNLDDQVKLCGLLTRPRSYRLHFANATMQRQFLVVKFLSQVARGFGFHIEGQQESCDDLKQTAKQSARRKAPHELISYDEPKQDQSQDADSSEPQQEANRSQEERQPESGGAEVVPEVVLNQNQEPGKQEQEEPQRPTTTTTTTTTQTASSSSRHTCNRLLTGQFNLIESDNFPGHYSDDINCLWAVRRLNQSVCAIDLVFNYFDLEAAEASSSYGPSEGTQSNACESDYLEIDYSRFCGSYPAQHRVRFNYFEQELDKLIRFRTDSSKTRSGFSIVVSQVMGPHDCQAQEESARQPASTNEPATLSQDFKQDSEARELINYLPDSTSSSTVEPSSGSSIANASLISSKSTNSSQQARNHQGQLGLGAGQSANNQPPTLCKFIYHAERQLLVSPSYSPTRARYDNNLDCQYKILAAGYDICSLRLTFIDLDLEQSQDCLNDYLLIDSQRYCGQLAAATLSSSQSKSSAPMPRAQHKSVEIHFDANLPREIDLLFHTDAHVNSGRGFKLLSEQVACQQQQPGGADGQVTTTSQPGGGPSQVQPNSVADQEFRLADSEAAARLEADSVARARQVRRMRFGQLKYPKNYVSSPAVSSGGGARANRAGRQQHHHHHHHHQTTTTTGGELPQVARSNLQTAGQSNDSDPGGLRLTSREIVVAARAALDKDKRPSV